VIEVKPEYRSSLSGKITLPSTDANGKSVTVLGEIAGSLENNGITEIYFLPDAKYKVIGQVNYGISAFYGFNNLTKVYFPPEMNSLKYLGKTSFANLSNLNTIVNLPNSIEYIGEMAFNWCNNL
jgi:hypothetical protein